MIVSFQEMLQDASRRHYAVPMYDASNGTMMKAAVECAEELHAPVILAAIPADIEGANLGYWTNQALYAAKQVKTPVCLHLDHSPSLELCQRCAEAGFQGVMLDASADPFDCNAARSAEVVKAVKLRGVGVEAELGHVASGITGGKGNVSEDGRSSDTETVFTDPESVVRFIEATNVDALAVSIGTTHGVYVSAPKLNIELLKKLHAATDVPLVLHGGSNTPADQLQSAIANGIAKINIYSELTAAWNTEMKKFLDAREQMTSWFIVTCEKAEAAMRDVMRAKIRMFNADGKF